MHKLTLVIPIHEINEGDFSFIEQMGKTIDEQQSKEKFKVAFVVSDKISKENCDKLLGVIGDDIQKSIVKNDGETYYQSQINFFVNNHADTPYFSVIQYDDKLLGNYIMNSLKYIESYPEYGMFTSIIFELDNQNNFIGFSNESVWAMGHMVEFGDFDLDNAKKHSFHNYNINGAIIKTETFKEVGGFKPSIKKFQDYEFLLRMLNKGVKVHTIPKVMYSHVNGRGGSIHDSQKDMSEDEKKFWYFLAQREFHFDFDREIEYTT